MIVRYEMPKNWIAYDAMAISPLLMEAKAAILALTRMPYQRSWADELQYIQLKREVAGTSRIEGVEFTERELEAALDRRPNSWRPSPNARLLRPSPPTAGSRSCPAISR